MALLPGSAAIGHGIAADYPGTITPITTDQRGMPLDIPPDIGLPTSAHTDAHADTHADANSDDDHRRAGGFRAQEQQAP